MRSAVLRRVVALVDLVVLRPEAKVVSGDHNREAQADSGVLRREVPVDSAVRRRAALPVDSAVRRKADLVVLRSSSSNNRAASAHNRVDSVHPEAPRPRSTDLSPAR